MTPIEKTKKADILNYLREAHTMQFNTRASFISVSFSGICDYIRIDLIPLKGGKRSSFTLYQRKDKAYNDQVMTDFKERWLHYEDEWLKNYGENYI